MFGGGSLGSTPLGGLTSHEGPSNDEAKSPIVTEINGTDSRADLLMHTLTIDETLGQPVTARFTLVNRQPQVGDQIRIRYFSQVIFAGIVDHWNKTSPDLTTMRYQCECLDWSQILLRRKLRRNFTNVTVQTVVDSILDNELAGESLTIGTIDARSTLPLVDARDANVFEVLRTIAGATGQTFYVDFDKTIQMRSTTMPVAPLVLNEANTLLDGSVLNTDTETYRNRQTVIVTGTPGEDEDALTTSIQRENTDQIAARAALEGGTGIYEEIEEITHPISNDGVELALLGIGYANLRLATAGATRFTFSCQVRGYGFRSGQIATVDLPTFGLVGTYVIERVSIREEAGVRLVYTLQLTNTSVQLRAYDAWLKVVGAGKVTVQVPASLTNNLQTFNTPGADTWTVPAGVTTAEFTCIGGSGGGGGGSYIWWPGIGGNPSVNSRNGGTGGNSGKAISIVNVVEGQVYDLVIGSAGTPGVSSQCISSCVNVSGSAGTAGTVSRVSLGGGSAVCQGDGGGLGGGSNTTNDGFYHYGGFNGSNGSAGSGIGDAVSVGGGKTGGSRGTGSPFVQPTVGQDGLVEVRW